MADATTLNQWESYDYYDPEPVLAKMRAIQLGLDLAALPRDIANLRTNALKSTRESWNAVIFTFGMGVRMGVKVLVAPVEDADFDFMTRWVVDGTVHYCPVQLKELVPDELNPDVTLGDLFEKIARTYPTSSETVVAILLNREFNLDLSTLTVPPMSIRELYFFSAIEPDQSRWVLLGDMLGTPTSTEFDHPAPAEHAA